VKKKFRIYPFLKYKTSYEQNCFDMLFDASLATLFFLRRILSEKAKQISVSIMKIILS